VGTFTTSISVSTPEQPPSVCELTTGQVVTSKDTEVEHVSRVSLEDLTQTHTEGYASSRFSVTV
jgi:hypothetical protein